MRPDSNPVRALITIVVLALIGSGCALVEDLPRLADEDLRSRLTPQTSKLYDAAGKLITTFHGAKDRTVVDIEAVPDHVQEAVVAIEDERFYAHDGVDLKGVARALAHNLTSDEGIQGGSTITQQYVKNRIIAPGEETAPDTLKRKIDEAALARQIETRLSKSEILERYLNTVYFGNGAYGIQAAAETYFGRPAKKLSIKQGAMLAGIIRTPESYDPYDRPKRAKRRRNLVVRKMEQLGYTSRARAKKITGYPLGLRKDPRKQRHDAPYFVDYVRRLLVHHPRFSFLGDSPGDRSDRLFSGGLRIHTTVHRGVQKAAEHAIARVLTQKNDPYASLVALDPRTGHIVAMVGGRDYFSDKRYSKLNLAIAGSPDLGRSAGGRRAPGTGRQAGSAFKAFALAAAIKDRFPVAKTLPGPECAKFPDPNRTEPWKVCNYGRAGYGRVSIKEATTKSINTAYAKLVLEVGPRKVTKMARRLGVRSDLLAVPSAVLGTNSVNALDMTTGYATLANRGIRRRPIAITRITTAAGDELYSSEPDGTRVLDPGSAYITTSLLRNVMQTGTGTAARLDRPAAGKTGTAQEYRDAWFAGYTPNLAAAVWVGYPAGSISMKTHCAQGRRKCRPTRIQVTGGSWPAIIWKDFMSSAVRKLKLKLKDFPRPDKHLVRVTIDRRTGCLASARTPTTARERVVVPTAARPPAHGPRCKKQAAEKKPSPRTDGNDDRGNQQDNDRRDRDRDQGSSDRPLPEPTKDPVPEPDPEPSEEPDPEPSDDPSPEPSAEPDPEPSSEPSPDPSPDPEPTAGGKG